MDKFKINEADWRSEGHKRYGDKITDWVMRCPLCKIETKVQEWLDHDAPNQVAFSCIGRAKGSKREALASGEGPCNYAGGGLFRLNPVTVVFPDGSESEYFDFAKDPLVGEG